ncbi:MAG: hypothetical protein KH291_08385, partial [Collinsella sp.]|nr:hypothetical protein [Collinsella sp.]
ASPPGRQSAFQLRRHDQKVNAALFQGTLLALAGFRCRCQNIDVVADANDYPFKFRWNGD